MWSRWFTNVDRPAQYRSSRSVGSTRASAAPNVMTSPEPTARPAPRSRSAKATSTLTRGAWSATRRNPVQIGPHQLEVVALLHHGAECVVYRAGVQVGRAEHLERAYPVDGLGDTGWLRQLEPA